VKRQTSIEAGVFVLLAAAAVSLRLYFQFIPNFAPVAALALFAGYFFHSRWTALALPLVVMMITDLAIGGYHPLMMTVVYAALAVPVFFRGPLRRCGAVSAERQVSAWAAAATSTGGLVACSLAASVFFYVVTNFGHWVIYDMYDKTAAGLFHCYAAALPFFRYTLAGDLAFACILFGGHALAVNLAAEKKSEAVGESV
jgi:hypothetical protein